MKILGVNPFINPRTVNDGLAMVILEDDNISFNKYIMSSDNIIEEIINVYKRFSCDFIVIDETGIGISISKQLDKIFNTRNKVIKLKSYNKYFTNTLIGLKETDLCELIGRDPKFKINNDGKVVLDDRAYSRSEWYTLQALMLANYGSAFYKSNNKTLFKEWCLDNKATTVPEEINEYLKECGFALIPIKSEILNGVQWVNNINVEGIPIQICIGYDECDLNISCTGIGDKRRRYCTKVYFKECEENIDNIINTINKSVDVVIKQIKNNIK